MDRGRPITREGESTGTSQLDPGLRDQKDVSQAIPKPSWLRDAIVLLSPVFLFLVVEWALMIYLTGGDSSFLEALMWSALGWSGWFLFCAIGVAAYVLSGKWIERHPEFMQWLNGIGHVIGKVMGWAFIALWWPLWLF
jgi:hypothetical protein